MTEAEKVICRLYLEDMDKNHTCNEYRLLMELLDRVLCEDAISRQDAIDMCRKPHMRNADCSDFEMEIMMLPPAQPEPQWIPVTEKLPEEGRYLVWMPLAPPKNRITVAEYCGEYWNIKTPVLAWMPLPAPYRGGKTV